MDPLALLALFAAALINAVIPGPGIALTIARAARDGAAAGLRVALGVCLSATVLVLLAWTIVTGALQLLPEALETIKGFGIVVLLVLGLHMLRASRGTAALQRTATRHGRAGDILAGVAVGLTSPINLLFKIAILPQFIAAESATPAAVALTLAAVLLATAIPMVGLAVLTAGAMQRRPLPTVWITRAGACCLLGFAALAAMGP